MTYRLSGRLLNKGLMGAVAALLLLMSLLAPARAELVQFVYTSDQHYGITRKAFRGLDKVSSREVNAAMVQAINTLPGISLPEDGGVRAGQPVQWADAVISNRPFAGNTGSVDDNDEIQRNLNDTNYNRMWEYNNRGVSSTVVAEAKK